MTTTTLLHLKLNRRPALVLARQRSRQVARLLGFDAADQARIAAAVFHLAAHAFQHAASREIVFQLAGGALHVYPVCGKKKPAGAEPPLRLERRLPRELAMPPEDVAWVVQELARITPANLFEEIRQQNQELLHAFQELHACRAEVERLTRPRPDAA
jgi:hypothetical protein